MLVFVAFNAPRWPEGKAVTEYLFHAAVIFGAGQLLAILYAQPGAMSLDYGVATVAALRIGYESLKGMWDILELLSNRPEAPRADADGAGLPPPRRDNVSRDR